MLFKPTFISTDVYSYVVSSLTQGEVSKMDWLSRIRFPVAFNFTNITSCSFITYL